MSEEPRYPWSVTESAPEEFPVQIVSGTFTLVDGTSKGIPARAIVNSGWGQGRSTIGAGATHSVLPASFDVAWFSFRENTFYQGQFSLPVDFIRESTEDTRGVPFTEAQAPIVRATIGLAPEGMVVVWLSSALFRREIFRGFAKPTEEISWSTILSNDSATREEYIDVIVSHEAKKYAQSPRWGMPNYWKALHETQFKYSFHVEAESDYYTLKMLNANNTSELVYFGDSYFSISKERPIPEKVSLNYLFEKRAVTVVVSDIDFNEMNAAFSLMSEKTPSPPRLLLKIGGDIGRLAIVAALLIEADDQRIELKNYKVKTIENKSALQHAGPHTMPYQNPKSVKQK